VRPSQPPAVDQGDVDRRNVQHCHRRGEIDIFCGNAVRRVNIEPVLQRFKSLRVEVPHGSKRPIATRMKGRKRITVTVQSADGASQHSQLS